MSGIFLHNGTEYEIRRNPRRKHPEAVLNSQGKIWIALPQDFVMDEEACREFARIIDKIIKRIDKYPIVKMPDPKKYCDGELFYYRGTQYPLRLRDGRGLDFDGKVFWLGREDRRQAAELFEDWYKQALYKIIVAEIHDFFVRTDTSPARISIHTVKTKWGSCSKAGNIIFNTSLALLPYNLYEYVVIHELCHLKEFNHSKKFWQEVEKYLPDYKERLATIKRDQVLYTWK